MKKLNKLLLKSYIGPLILTFFIALVVLLMQFLWKYMDDLVGKGIELSIVLKFIFYASLLLVPMALPLAVLLASLMTMGNLGERYELVAMKSAGISLAKAVRPMAVLTLIICGMSFYFSNNIMPEAFLRYRTMLHSIQTKKPAVNIREGVFYNQMDGYVIRIGKKNRDGKHIQDVQIYDHTGGPEHPRMTMAKSGIMQTTADGKYLVFTLFDGYTYEDQTSFASKSPNPFGRAKFGEQQIRFDLSAFKLPDSDESLFRNHYRQKNLAGLNHQLDTLRQTLNEEVDNVSHFILRNHRFYAMMQDDSTIPTRTIDTAFNVVSKPIPNENRYITSSISPLMGNLSYENLNISGQKEYIYIHEIEANRKFSLSFACMVLFLIGAPLGAIIRKGGLGMPVVVSVFLFISFHVGSLIGEKYVRTGEMPVWEGMWITPFIFLCVGAFLLYKSNQDSSLLDADSWRRTFNRLIGRK